MKIPKSFLHIINPGDLEEVDTFMLKILRVDSHIILLLLELVQGSKANLIVALNVVLQEDL